MKMQETKKRKTQSETTRRMVTTAMFSAITALLAFTPLGMIQLPPPLPAVTLVHIPVILAALVETSAVGLTVGLVFGVCSLIRAWESSMLGLTLFFRNPLVSVLPRLIVPLAAAAVYFLWRKYIRQNAVTAKAGVALAAVSGAVTNTVCCLGMLLLLYGNDLNEMIQGMHAGTALNWLVVVVGIPNGITEAIVAAVLVPVLKTAIEAVQRRAGSRTVSSKERNG